MLRHASMKVSCARSSARPVSPRVSRRSTVRTADWWRATSCANAARSSARLDRANEGGVVGRRGAGHRGTGASAAFALDLPGDQQRDPHEAGNQADRPARPHLREEHGERDAQGQQHQAPAQARVARRAAAPSAPAGSAGPSPPGADRLVVHLHLAVLVVEDDRDQQQGRPKPTTMPTIATSATECSIAISEGQCGQHYRVSRGFMSLDAAHPRPDSDTGSGWIRTCPPGEKGTGSKLIGVVTGVHRRGGPP